LRVNLNGSQETQKNIFILYEKDYLCIRLEEDVL